MTFPVTLSAPLVDPGPFPAAADVAVVGGGIAGVMTAWHLADLGLRAVVLEKGRVAGEQSGRNWGWIRAQGRDPAELPLILDARRQWEGLAAALGPGLGHRRCGVLYLAGSATEMAGFEAWLPHAQAHGLDTELWPRAAAADRLGPAGGWQGALWTASDARAEPWAALPLIARAAVTKGVRIIEGCAARALDLAGGRVAGVVTERGRIAAPAVVVAGGAWSRLFLGRHGVGLPQLSVLSSVLATAPLAAPFPGNAAAPDFAFRARADGGLTIAPGGDHRFYLGPDAFRSARAFLPVLRRDWRHTALRPAAPPGFPDAWFTPRRWDADRPSPFEACRILNPSPDRGALDRAAAAFARAFPALGPPQVVAQWAGMIDTTPDVLPVLDAVAALPGLFIATGLSGHGFGIGPGVGRAMAGLVAGRDQGFDLAPFRLARFSDGTALRPGPAP